MIIQKSEGAINISDWLFPWCTYLRVHHQLLLCMCVCVCGWEGGGHLSHRTVFVVVCTCTFTYGLASCSRDSNTKHQLACPMKHESSNITSQQLSSINHSTGHKAIVTLSNSPLSSQYVTEYCKIANRIKRDLASTLLDYAKNFPCVTQFL